MALLLESFVSARATRAARVLQKSVQSVLRESARSVDENFNIFLSHSSSEPEAIILGVKLLLEDHGFSVYVDKYSDPFLSPDSVTQATAEILRRRMQASDSLLYLHSRHSKNSRWMPWELGYFDGAKGQVGIIPVSQYHVDGFKGEEYLGLYPYVDMATTKEQNQEIMWINRDTQTYVRLDKWVREKAPIEKRG